MITFIQRFKPAALVAVLALLPLPALAGYTEGMECFKSKDYDCAVREFLVEVQAHPDYDFGWFMIGVSHLQKKEYDKAIENLNKAIEINGQKLSYHLNKSNVYILQQQYQKVVETLSGKEDLSGDSGEIYRLNYNLGTAYHKTEQHAKATPLLEKAVAVKPDYATYFMLGVSYDALGQPDKSIAALKEALKQKPGDGGIQSELANAYLEKAQRENDKARKDQFYTEALNYASGAVKGSPNDHSRLNVLARAYLGAGNFDQAEKTFQKVISLKPNYCYAHINLGKVYIAKEDWNSAARVLTEATKCDSKSAVAWESLGFAQEKIYKTLDTDQAKISQLNKALDSFKKAAAIKSTGSLTESIRRVQQNIDISNQNIQIAQSNLKTMETNLNNLKKGKADAQKALEDATKQRQFFLDKNQWPDDKEAEYQKEKGEIEKAISDYEKRIAEQEKELEAARTAGNPTS